MQQHYLVFSLSGKFASGGGCFSLILILYLMRKWNCRFCNWIETIKLVFWYCRLLFLFNFFDMNLFPLVLSADKTVKFRYGFQRWLRSLESIMPTDVFGSLFIDYLVFYYYSKEGAHANVSSFFIFISWNKKW